MASKGQFKRPVLPLNESCEMVMRAIERSSDGVAVFMLGGQVKCVRKTAAEFNTKTKVLASNLVGVYNLGFDHSSLRADLEVFYK